MVHNEEEASTTRRQQLTSDVWCRFKRNRPAAAGGATTATCGECGLTLRAGSSIGTSHLRRHTGTKRCRRRAAERRRRLQRTAAAAAYPGAESLPPGDCCSTSPPAYLREEFFVVDGIDIPELLDDLTDKGLVVNVDEPSDAADEHFSANSYVAAVPQAASLSTRWFRQKKKERQVKGAESKKSNDESDLDMSAQTTDFSSRDKSEDDVPYFGWRDCNIDNPRQFSRTQPPNMGSSQLYTHLR